MKNFRHVSYVAAVKVILLLVCWLPLASLASAQTNFCIQSIQRNTNGSVTLTWPAIPTWTYHVMYSDNLTNGWQDFPGGILTAGTNDLKLTYTDTKTVSLSQRFYKVRTGLARHIITLVVDRSGSMGVDPPNGSGGGVYLASSLTDFVNLFDDNRDEMAMVSFSSTANVDVPMGKPFKSAISSVAGNLQFIGGTFAQGGLVNALAQNDSVAGIPGQSTLKVVIYFTDGGANMVQQTLSCGTALNFGGIDDGNYVAFWDPATPENSPLQGTPSCWIPDGFTLDCFNCTASNFFSFATNASVPFARTNVTAEAHYEAIQTARQMQSEGIYVFSIGLGYFVDTTFLQEIANDPNSPTFDPSLPVGQTVITTDPAQLDQMLQSLASIILAQ